MAGGSGGSGGSFLDILKQTAPATAAKIKPNAAPPPVGKTSSFLNAAPAGLPANIGNLIPQPGKYYAVPKNANAKTIQYINSTNKINDQAAAFDKQPVTPDKKGIWGNIMDILGRTGQAVTHAVSHGQDAAGKAAFNHQGLLGQIEAGLGALPGGASEGIQGHGGHIYFPDVIQHMEDNALAKKQHVDPATTRGKAKVSGLEKYGLGVPLDFIVDPQNLVGLGVVSKVAKTAGMAARGAEALAAGAKYAHATHSADEIASALGHGMQQGTTVASDVQRGAAMQQAAEVIKNTAKAEGAKAAQATQKAAYAAAPLGSIPDGTKIAQAMSAADKARRAEVTKELTDIAHANIFPETRKAVQTKIAGLPVGSAMLPGGAAKGLSKAAKAPGIEQALKGLSDTFQSPSSRLPDAIHQGERAATGDANRIMDATAGNIRGAYKGVGKEDRQRVWEQAANGLFNVPVKGGEHIVRGTDQVLPVGNLAQHVDSRITALAQRIVDEGLAGHEVTAQLPNHAFSADKLTIKDPILDKKGNIANPRWLHEQVMNENWAKKMHMDPAQLEFTLTHAIESAAQHAGQHNDIARQFGIKADSKVGKRLAKEQGWRTPTAKVDGVNALPYHQNLVYHPDVAKGIENLHRLSRDRTGTIPLFDKSLQVFKRAVTSYSPGFYSRNLLGEIANSAQAGVLNPKYYKGAADALVGRHPEFMGMSPGGEAHLSRAQTRIANGLVGNPTKIAASIAQPRNHSILSNLVGKSGRRRFKDIDSDHISNDLLMHAYKSAGIDTGFTHSDLGMGVEGIRGGLAGRALHGVNQGANNLSQAVENYARMAHFLHAIDNSKASTFEQAVKEAAQIVRKYHFDYNDFSKAERAVFSRAIPFYKWTRKNIPLQVQMMLSHPGRSIMPYKGLNDLSRALGGQDDPNQPVPSGQEGVEPDYLHQAEALPVGMHSSTAGKSKTSNQLMLNAALPFGQAFQMFGGGGTHGLTLRGILGDTGINLAQMSNPFIKLLYELTTGTRVGGAPITDKKKYLLSQLPSTSLGQGLAVNQTDPANTGQTANNKFKLSQILTDPKFANFLTGAGISEITPKVEQGAAKQAQTAASARRKDAIKKAKITTLHTGVRGGRRGTGR